MRLVWTLVIVLCSHGAASAADTASPSGAGLDAEVHASWTRVPLRAWVARVSSLAGRPVILDRRIDPDIAVTLTARGEPLRDVLARVAATAGGTVDELESTVRIVPASASGKARLADEDRRLRLAKASASARRILTSTATWSWPTAARPRDLLETLASEHGLDVRGLDAVPHDHFPATDLPKLSLAERFDLVLAHFDRRVAWTTAGTPSGRVVTIDAEISPAAIAKAGRPAARPPEKPSRPAAVKDEFTLRLEAPLDQALMAMAGQLGLEIDIDRESLVARGVALGEIVRADVKNVSREKLFDAILHPIGLAWHLDGKRLRVFAPARGE
jgi:hypothetical protein